MAFRFDRFVDKFASGNLTAEDLHDALHAAALAIARGLPRGATMQGTDGRHWWYTGEYRPPQAQEWFFDGAAFSQSPHGRKKPYTIWLQYIPEQQKQRQAPPPPRPQNTRADALAELALPVHATRQEIRAQYLRLMKQYHPDRNPGDLAAERICKRVSAAYEVLK